MISTRRNTWKRGTIVAVAVLFAEVAQAQTWSEWGSIREIEAGWSQDTIAIFHSASFVNPGKTCTATDGSYATNPADPGHSLFHTVALSAFLNRKEVRFLILGCIFNKPHIIAVDIR